MVGYFFKLMIVATPLFFVWSCTSPSEQNKVTEITTQRYNDSVYVGVLPEIIRSPNARSLNKVEESLGNKVRAPSDFITSLTSRKPMKKYLSKNSNKAMYGAHPLSCNFRYASWATSKTLRYNLQNAFNKCTSYISKQRQKKQNCDCQLIAANNTFFRSIEYYLGGKLTLPFKAELDGRSIILGSIKIRDSSPVSTFRLFNDNASEICTGNYNLRIKPGNVSVKCKDGLTGSGVITSSGIDPDTRLFNGAGLVTLNNGQEMKIFWGPNAL